MRTVFADTFYFLALLDSREAFHQQASQFSRDSEVQILTTEWVLAEFGNAYSDPRDRADFVNLYRILIVHPRVKIIPAQTSLFQKGFELFAERADKEWSLVDCISFRVMQREGLTEALTGDHHFEQAGFTALLC
jgi:predicted nucleic acid-binding protein